MSASWQAAKTSASASAGGFKMSGSLSLGAALSGALKEKLGSLAKVPGELEALHNKDVENKNEEARLIRQELATLAEAVNALFAELNLRFEASGGGFAELKQKIDDLIKDLANKMADRMAAESRLSNELANLKNALEAERRDRASSELAIRADMRSQLQPLMARLDELGGPVDSSSIKLEIKSDLEQDLGDLRDALNQEVADRKAAEDPLLEKIGEIRDAALAELQKQKDGMDGPLKDLQDQLDRQRDGHRPEIDMLRREMMSMRPQGGNDGRVPDLERKIKSLEDGLLPTVRDQGDKLNKVTVELAGIPRTIQDEIDNKMGPLLDGDKRKFDEVNRSVTDLRKELMDLLANALADLKPIKEELEKLKSTDQELDAKIGANTDRINDLLRQLQWLQQTTDARLNSCDEKDRDLERKLLSRNDDNMYANMRRVEDDLGKQMSGIKNALNLSLSSERSRREEGFALLDENIQMLINLFRAIGNDINGAGLASRRRLSITASPGMKMKVEISDTSPAKRQKVDLTDDSKCKACGNTYMPDAKYCRNCGQVRGKTPLQTEEEKGKALEDKFGKMYDDFDKKKAGEIPIGEIKKLVFKDDAAKNKDFVENVDTDGDGKVSRAEFVAYMTYANMDKDAAFWALFNEIDVDRDGTLTKEEIRGYKWWNDADFFRMLGISNWHAMTAKIAKDGAKVTRQQFIDHMKATPVKQTFPQTTAVPKDAVKEELKPVTFQPAWKKAMNVSAAKTKADPNKCWDYSAGYCFRGARCGYKHMAEGKVDKAALDAHKNFCLKKARESGVNLHEHALKELQTLKEEDVHDLVSRLGPNGSHEHVYDKNNFVISSARSQRAKAGLKNHPDWEWYHGKNRRQQHW